MSTYNVFFNKTDLLMILDRFLRDKIRTEQQLANVLNDLQALTLPTLHQLVKRVIKAPDTYKVGLNIITNKYFLFIDNNNVTNCK